VAPDVLRAQVESQCRALRTVAEAHRTAVTSAKLHGALYHAAHRDAETARAVLAGIGAALGPVAIVGLPGGELSKEAQSKGHPYLREAFADRGVRPDGTLVPRGQPGAVLDDPEEAASRAKDLVARDAADLLCVHADTPAAVAIATAVRSVLDRP
jgi:UPF0271 protein